MTQQNISGVYKWTPKEVLTAGSESELLDCLKKVQSEKRSLRVIASAWSANQFLNPNTALGDAESGYNLALKGSLCDVPYGSQWRPDDEYAKAKGLDINEMVTVGAACQRQGIYTFLDSMFNGEGRDIYGSGECFTSAESQQLGGLIANAVHDTMECAFTPETVVHVRAAVFENGEPVIRDFTDKDGDAFFAFFGGFGAAGVIVAATLITKPRSFYHKLSYSPGSDVYSQYAPDTPPPKLDAEYPIASLEEALLDLVEKASDTCDGDLAAIFVIFSSDENKNTKLMLSRALSRYFKKAKALPALDKPGTVFAPVKRDAFNDPPAFLSREYCTTPQTIEALVPHVLQVEDAIAELKYKASNMKTLGRAGYAHEAYFDGNAARITGPHYVYLWEKALEFYVPLPRKTSAPKPMGPYRSQYFARSEQDYDYSYIKAFAAIIDKWVRKLFLNRNHKAVAAKEGAGHEGADHDAPVSDAFLSDCRFVCASENGFMTGFYGEDAFAVDVGCQKFHFTNEEFTTFAYAVLDDCIAQKIPVRLHTGKFFVYDKKYVQYMYGEATKHSYAPANSLARLDAIRKRHDPENVFAPAWMRDLFAPESTV